MPVSTDPQVIALKLIEEHNITRESLKYAMRYIYITDAIKEKVKQFSDAQLGELLGNTCCQAISTTSFFEHELATRRRGTFYDMSRSAAVYVILFLIKEHLDVLPLVRVYQ